MWDLPPPDPGIEILIASRGISKGIAQTDGIQIVPKAFVQLGQVQIGGQWKNITSPVADGEAAAFVNYAPKLGAFQLALGAAYKFQTNVIGNPDHDAFEFTAGASRKIGKAGFRTSAVFSPDDIGGSRRSLYLEAGPSFDLDGSTRLSANIGRRSRVAGLNYTSFNAGVSKTFAKKVTVDVRYYDTAQGELGEIYDDRFVVSARLAL